MIDFMCPKCNERMSVPRSLAGQKQACPSCGQMVRVPASMGFSPPATLPAQQVPATSGSPQSPVPRSQQTRGDSRQEVCFFCQRRPADKNDGLPLAIHRVVDHDGQWSGGLKRMGAISPLAGVASPFLPDERILYQVHRIIAPRCGTCASAEDRRLTACRIGGRIGALIGGGLLGTLLLIPNLHNWPMRPGRIYIAVGMGLTFGMLGGWFLGRFLGGLSVSGQSKRNSMGAFGDPITLAEDGWKVGEKPNQHGGQKVIELTPNMPIVYDCGKCGVELRTKGRMMGKTEVCPKCKTVNVVH